MPLESSNRNPISRTEENPYGIQHDPMDYFKPSYLDPARMSSYGYQYKLAMETGGNSFINVGSGNHLLKYLLTTQKKSVIDFDLDFETQPDVVGVFPLLPFRDKTFDVALCFQTLEHFPFSTFLTNISELNRVANKIVLSLPDRTNSKSDNIKYDFYKKLKFPKEWKVYLQELVGDEHFWEIGDGKVTLDLVVEALSPTNLHVVRQFRNQFHRYHHFFVLEIKQS